MASFFSGHGVYILHSVVLALDLSCVKSTVATNRARMIYDRRKKHVVVNGKYIVPYDHLILCLGIQYQVPEPTGLDVDTGATNSDLENADQPQPQLLDPVPKNVFVMNDAYEAAVFLYWLEINALNAGSMRLMLQLFIQLSY